MWSAAVVVAVGAASTAVAMAGSDRRDSGVLSQEDVARQLRASDDQETAGAGPASGAPTAPDPSETPSDNATTSAPPSDTGDGVHRMPVKGASIVVECRGDVARLVSWSPNQGYRVDDVAKGPAREVSVYLESDQFNDVKYVITCSPLNVKTLEEFDDHGGGRGGKSGRG
jgi:hypothetical protein